MIIEYHSSIPDPAGGVVRAGNEVRITDANHVPDKIFDFLRQVPQIRQIPLPGSCDCSASAKAVKPFKPKIANISRG